MSSEPPSVESLALETENVPEKVPKKEWESQHKNDAKHMYGGRDMAGYQGHPPNPHWPRSAKVAVNFVINYEEGAEACLLHGDEQSEHLISDIPGAVPLVGKRNLNMESMYDYGARSGFWRLHRLFAAKKLPATVFACGMALERNIAAVGAMKEAGWEIASHGYRWQDYSDVDEETEREHIARTIEIHQNLLGKRPFGFYQGKPNENTRRLVVEEGGFLYDSDSYADDLPYWCMEYANGRPHLVIPYTLTENDMKFVSVGGSFTDGQSFANHLKDTLKFLVEEGRAGQPKMMTVALHCRLARPGRAAALADFMDYAKSYGREVWICTREQIANHWYEKHLPRGVGSPIKTGAVDGPSSSVPSGGGYSGSGGGGSGGGYSGSSGGGGGYSGSSGGGGGYSGSNGAVGGGYLSSSGGGGGYSGSSGGGGGPPAQGGPSASPASRFAFLGNITAPREEVDKGGPPSPTEDDGDII